MRKEDSHFDCVVLGLGAMGSASVYHLAKAGAKVLGIDQFAPPHQLGSSTGETRIIREAYFEHPSYVPLVQRAYQLWEELQGGEQPLFIQTGGLMIGTENGIVVQGALESARTHALKHEFLTPAQVTDQFPQFTIEPGMAAVWEPRAGILFPEKCIATHLTKATEAGASISTNEKVISWKSSSSGVVLQTDLRTITANRLAICSGAWIKNLVSDLNLPFQVERQIQFWFQPTHEKINWESSPVYLCETPDGELWYGFPNLGEGVKVARHHNGFTIDPNSPDRAEKPDDEPAIRNIVSRFMPSADGQKLRSRVCIYTNSPDGHFLLDWHPSHRNILLVSPCSGHGFKFAAAIGKLVKDFLLDQKINYDLSLFKFRW